jgi:hypothetical protein
LLVLTERDFFRKINDFATYNQALDNSSQQDLIDISQTGEHEQRFLQFLRYIELIENENELHIQGKKFIDRIYVIPRFQAYKGHSLQILEN